MSDRIIDLLVVGANSRVGRLLIPAFRDAGVPVALTHRCPERLDSALPELVWAPLEGPGPLLDWCAEAGVPRAMLVLAGVTPGSGGDPQDNVSIGLACRDAARAAGIGRVLLASSAAVYGHDRATAWSEDDPVAPVSDYGRAKLAMERACAGPGVCALRIGNVAGADSLLTNPVRPVTLDRFGSGDTALRSYVGPRTLARVVAALTRAPALPPLLNVAAPRPVTMAEMAEAAGIAAGDRPAPPETPARLFLDTRRLESLMAFADSESTASGLVAQWRACQPDP